MNPSSPSRQGWIGAAFCFAAAILYTITNICLRQLSLECDPMWVVCVKEGVTVFVIGGWIARECWRGRKILPGGKTLWWLIVVAVLNQLFGNLAAQWALGVVGLAVSIPATFGVQITGGAFLGWAVLGERLSLRVIAAITVLWAALVLLGVGAEAARISTASAANVVAGPVHVALGVGAACLAGVIYSILNVTASHSVRNAVSPLALVFLFTLMAPFTLGPLCIYRFGLQTLLETPLEHLLWMGAAGILNMVGFLALAEGLRRTTVAHASLLNASQVAMAAAAGMFVFQEQPNLWLLLGIGLTIAGILGAGRPAHEEEFIDQHV